MEKEQAKLLQQVGKGKEIIEWSEPEGSKGKGKRKSPRTRGLKKALQGDNQDKEYWLNRVNEHLNKLLEKENRDNQFLRHMAHHYQAQNMITNVKVK